MGRKDGGERLLTEAGKGVLPAGHCRPLCTKLKAECTVAEASRKRL